MKPRMTAVMVGVILVGAVGIIAFTAAQPTEFVYAKFGVDMDADRLPDIMYDCWTDGIPGNESEIIEVTPMPPEQGIRKVPGLARFENVRIRFGLGQLPPPLAAWHELIASGAFVTHDATLVLTGAAGEALSTATLAASWPCAIRLAQSRVGFRGDVAEEMELVVGQCTLLGAGDPTIPDRK